MSLLDVPVVPDPPRPDGAPRLRAALARPRRDACLSVVVLGAALLGVKRLEDGARKRAIPDASGRTSDRMSGRMRRLLGHRLRSLSEAGGAARADIPVHLQATGRPLPLAEGLIAAAVVHDLTHWTRTVRDFGKTGARAFNPLGGLMDFALTEEQEAIFAMARDFARDRIAPFAAEWEAAGTIPREALAEAGALGFAAMYVPEEMGGAGLSRLDATLVFEALAMGCPAVASFISIHNMCASMVAAYGSESLRDRWLPRLVTLEAVAAYCLTEPGSGSDAAALRTRAARGPAGWTLDGTKAFISGGGYADLYLVMARTGAEGPKGVSTLAVEAGAPGLSFGAQEKKMGWRAQPTAQVQFDACAAPADALLGEEGKGFVYAMKGLDGGRLNIAAAALGGAQAALDTALAYTGERRAFGQAIRDFQAIQFRLADMETELQAARVFLRQAAWKLDRGAPDATKHCAMAKRFVTDAAFKVANDALQLLGGYGYLADYGIEKIVRDLRVHQILEGTNEIMRVIVARALIAEAA